MFVSALALCIVANTKITSVSMPPILEDGEEPLQLTFSKDSDQTPRFGPNGKIVYISSSVKGISIMTMSGDGADKQQVINCVSGTFEHPSWGPNGEILFTFLKNGCGNLFIVRSDGSGLRQLTNYQHDGDAVGVWGKDGTIVYSVDFMFETATNRRGYYTISPDGTNLKRLGRTRLGRVYDWPSGGPIFFTESESGRLFQGTYRDNNGEDPKGYSTRPPGIHYIFAMEENGAGGRRLTTDLSECFQPVQCPDGRIVFTQIVKKRGNVRSSIRKLMIMDADGTNIKPLTTKSGGEHSASVSASGSVVYSANYGGNLDIYSIKLPER